MKLVLIALALAAAPSALAMAPYVPSELNGCDEPCAGVETINTEPFEISLESGTCYVVDGTIATVAEIPADINCAKITIPSGSSLNEIAAHLPRPSHGCPAKR